MARAAVFDAYGTLLDVNTAMRAHASRLGQDWQRISQEWRDKHIEYTWVRSLAGPAQHRSFWELAKESLAVVAARNGIEDAALLDDILGTYRRLETYPEVPAALGALKARGMTCAILSNGDPDMLKRQAEHSGIAELLDATISAEEAGVFKPHPSVYALATSRLGLPASEVAFFSSNPWDAFGARCFGFQVFWVNRKDLPDEYGLRATATVLRDLRSVNLENPGTQG